MIIRVLLLLALVEYIDSISIMLGFNCINSTNLTQCESRYGFQLTASYQSFRYNQIICVPKNQTCRSQGGNLQKFNLTPCQEDSDKKNCITKICYSHPFISDRTRNVTLCRPLKQQCQNYTDKYNSKCTNEMTVGNQTNIYDYLGQKCNCCYNITKNASLHKFCTYNNTFLNQNNLTKWFHIALALSSAQSVLYMMAALIFIVIIQ